MLFSIDLSEHLSCVLSAFDNCSKIGWFFNSQTNRSTCSGFAFSRQSRKLKPSNNILLNQPSPDFVKIVDFGLAKLTADPSAKKLTQTGLLIGTVEYMSPEQCAGRTADLRSDIYSLACVLYACLVSEPPFSSDSPVGTIYKHANELPLAPSKKLNESLCAGIDEILLKGLSKAPDDRYQSMDELGQDLESLLKGELPVVASLASPQPRVRKTLTVATAVALSTFFAVVALFFLRPKPPDEIKVAPKLETLSDSQARVILDKATDFIDDDKPLEAEIICKEVLAKKLNSFCHIRALEHLATSYGMRKDFQKEAKTWDEVIRLTSADERKRRIGQPELEHDTVLANAIMTQSADFVALNKDAEALANFKRFEELGDRSQINESTRTQFMRTKGGYLEVKKGLNAAFDFYKSFAEKNANTFCGLEPIVRCLGILEKTKRSQTSEYKELSQKN